MRSLLAGLCLVALSAHADALLIDRIAAVVDAHAITKSTVDARARAALKAATTDAEKARVLDETLTTLIEERLILNDALRMRLSVSDQEIESALAEIGKQTRLSPEQLMAEVKRQGLTPDSYRALLAQQLLEMRWLNIKMNRNSIPPDVDRAAFMANERTRLLTALRQEFFIEVRR